MLFVPAIKETEEEISRYRPTTEEVAELLHANNDGGRLERKLGNIGQGESLCGFKSLSYNEKALLWLRCLSVFFNSTAVSK